MLNETQRRDECPYFDDTVQLNEVMTTYAAEDAALNQHDDTDLHTDLSGSDKNKIVQRSSKRSIVTVGILLLINLLNYMDRFTIAGVLIQVKNYYHGLSNSEAGSLQTAFICAYMVFSPIFGYLGDRYTRKYIIAIGIFLWSALTFASSFIPDNYFWGFVLLRALVGIGEASYSTIAPTIIADLFSKDNRTTALMVFYFAIPVGSGLGYIVGSNVAELLHEWQWALRVTPGLGCICVLLILLFCEEPERGMSEGSDVHLANTSLFTDLKDLAHNKSLMLSSVGFTCVAFVTGALAFLAPTFMVNSTEVIGLGQGESTVGLIFGIITVAAGIIGVALGTESARRFKKINPRADPLVCAFGMMTSAPFLFFSLVMSRYNTTVTWILIFLGEVLLCLNWAVTADILLYVVIPTRRSLAESGQILMSHAFGDAISPYIIGKVADALASGHPNPEQSFVQFQAMQIALYITTFVCVIGGGFYLATAIFLENDKKKAEKITHGIDNADIQDDDMLVQDAGIIYVADEEPLI